MWACAQAADKAEEVLTIDAGEEIEDRLRAEIEALRKELSIVLASQHERLLKLEAGGELGVKGSQEAEGEEASEPVAVVMASDLDARGQEVELGGSTWDACLIVGAPCLGAWGSLGVCLCTLLNIGVQTIFVALVFANFLETEFSKEDITGFKAWRLLVAHDDRYTSLTGTSLASRVCGQDPTLELSNEQSAKVDLIRSYLPSLDPELSNPGAFSKEWLKIMFDGSVMCLVAVSCWVLTVAKELGSIFETMCVVLWLPLSRRLGVQVAEDPDGRTRILSAGVGSKVFMLLVLLVRLSVALALLVMGCLYLAYTSSMQDLLLNAVALECVMTIDELVYEALGPRRARQVLRKLAPLHLPPWRRGLRQLDTKTVFLGALLAGVLVLVGVGPLKEHMDNLAVAHTELCGGRVDFAASVDSLSVLHAQDTSSFDADTAFEALGLTAQTRAVLELISGKPQSDLEYSLTPGDYAYPTLAQIRSADILKLTTGIYTARAVYSCHDALDLTLFHNLSTQQAFIHFLWPTFTRQRRVWLHYLRTLPGSSPDGQSCADFSHLCFEQLVKAVCPETCGCNSLMHGWITDNDKGDCPMTCRRRIEAREKAETTCEDASPNNASDPKWQRFVEYAGYLGSPAREMMLNKSCPGLVTDGLSPMCESPTWLRTSEPLRTSFSAAGDYRLKLITLVCPVTCNCGGRGGRLSSALRPPAETCPDTCTCPWEYSETQVDDGDNCTVPHYVPGYALEPVDTSAKCCFLMKETSRLLMADMAGAHDSMGWVALMKALCHPCYGDCLQLLWTLRHVGNPNWVFASVYSLAQFGTAQPPITSRQAFCALYDSGQLT